MLYASFIVKRSFWPFGSLACRIGVVGGLHTAKLNAKRALCFLEKNDFARAVLVPYSTKLAWQVGKVMCVGCETGLLLKGNIECEAGALLAECVCEKVLMQREGGNWCELYNCKPPCCWGYHLRLFFFEKSNLLQAFCTMPRALLALLVLTVRTLRRETAGRRFFL